MTISDDELQARLGARAGAVQPVDVAAIARAVAETPQRTRLRTRTRFIGLASAVASVAVALAIAGSLVLRPAAPASPAPGTASGPVGSIAGTPAGSTARAEKVWSDLVWGKADAAPFAFDGNTYVQDAIPDAASFIAVGHTIDTKGVVTGRIWRTSDGRSWGLVEGDWLANVAFDGGFVIIGLHRQPDVGEEAGPMRLAVWWSRDGTAWEERTPPDSASLFVGKAAAGPAGLLLSASDPAGREYWLVADAEFHWNRLTADWPDDVRISGISAGGPGWIATGVTGIDTLTSTGGTSKGAIWTSPDGVTWSPAAIEQPGGSMGSVSRVIGGFVATGGDRNMACTACTGQLILFDPLVTWFSSDGLSWQRTGAFQTRIGNFFGGAFATNDGQRMLVFEMGEDRRLKVEETRDGVNWRDIAMWHETTMSAPDVEAFPAFRVPFVGNAGLIAFDDGAAGVDPGESVAPVPWYALVSQPQPPNAATFPPRPEPSNTDVVCPGTEPCGGP